MCLRHYSRHPPHTSAPQPQKPFSSAELLLPLLLLLLLIHSQSILHPPNHHSSPPTTTHITNLTMFGFGTQSPLPPEQPLHIHPFIHSSTDTLPPGEARDQYSQVENNDNKAELSHEVLAGGASFMAMKMFEDRQRKEGKKQLSPTPIHRRQQQTNSPSPSFSNRQARLTPIRQRAPRGFRRRRSRSSRRDQGSRLH